MRISRHKIYAAEGDFDDEFGNDFGGDFGGDDFGDDGFMSEDESLGDTIDDMQDDLEDMQDDLEDVVEDDPNIDADNNIENHYIAECERCKGIFISAVVESDQDIEKITGTCPLCDRETDQYLRWVVKPIE